MWVYYLILSIENPALVLEISLMHLYRSSFREEPEYDTRLAMKWAIERPVSVAFIKIPIPGVGFYMPVFLRLVDISQGDQYASFFYRTEFIV